VNWDGLSLTGKGLKTGGKHEDAATAKLKGHVAGVGVM